MSEPLALLVVEDDPKSLAMFGRIAEQHGARCVLEGSFASAKASLSTQAFDMVLLDRNLPDGDGIELIDIAKESNPKALVVMVTAHGTIDIAVEAMKRGAWDFLIKPFCFERMEVLIQRAQEHFQSQRENERLRREVIEARFGDIIGSSPPIRAMKERIAQIAPTPSTILIQGETGVGKELASRAVHRASSRSDGPFVAVDCAAIPETLLESTLFGHERGAFTDAHASRKGMVELASKGTLFLDEVAELAPSLQAKLLRLLQERVYRPIGSEQEKNADIRVLAATRWDLDTRTREGLFREDLYYRLNVITLTLPPLRARPGDIPILANHFLYRQTIRSNKTIESISEQAMHVLRAYRWPGNVRELQHAIEHAVAVSTGITIIPETLPPGVQEAIPVQPVARFSQEETLKVGHEAAYNNVPWKDFEESVIKPYAESFVTSLLSRCESNVSAAARLAGLSRNGFYALMRKAGIQEGQ